MKLFVGGLAWATDDASLRAAFQPFGNLSDAVVIKDRDTGRSRGFGFVTYSDDASGNAALQAMNGATLDGRSIRCDAAVERERGSGPGPGGPRPGGMDRPPRDDAPRFGGGGGGGGGGGFQGGGGGGFQGGGGGGGFQGGGGGGGAPPRGRGGPPDRGRSGGPGPGRGGGGGGAGGSEWGSGPRGGKRRGGGNRRQDDDFGDD